MKLNGNIIPPVNLGVQPIPVLKVRSKFKIGNNY